MGSPKMRERRRSSVARIEFLLGPVQEERARGGGDGGIAREAALGELHACARATVDC